jgi:EF hand
MKKSALLVALSAASLAGGIAFAQTYPQTTQPQTTQPEATKPSGADTKPGTSRPAMDDASFSLATLDTNKDGVVDKQEARASANLTAIFDKADTNKDGKLDASELSAAASMSKRQ